MSVGGWTVVQKRFNGNVSFARNYQEYTDGFGSVSGDHWLGLEWIHLLTSNTNTTSSVRISVESYDGIRGYQHHGDVSVDDRDSNYTLRVTKTAQSVSALPHETDSEMSDFDEGLYASDGFGFTTSDHDVDGDNEYINCADMFGGGGGWWYHWCSGIYINSIYGKKEADGIRLWYNIDYHYSVYVTNPSMSVMRN
jgi:ficolin